MTVTGHGHDAVIKSTQQILGNTRLTAGRMIVSLGLFRTIHFIIVLRCLLVWCERKGFLLIQQKDSSEGKILSYVCNDKTLGSAEMGGH